MKTCFYCGEPAVYFEDDNGYCKRCWDETEVNIAKHRREQAVDALVKAARELLDAHDATVYRAMMPRRKRRETPLEQVLAIHGRLADAKQALRAALAALDGEPK